MAQQRVVLESKIYSSDFALKTVIIMFEAGLPTNTAFMCDVARFILVIRPFCVPANSN